MDWTSIIMGFFGAGTFAGIGSFISNIKYRKENKRLKESQVSQSEAEAKKAKAEAKNTEGDALTIIENNYTSFVKHYERILKEVLDELEEVKNKDKQKTFEIAKLARQNGGLTREYDKLRKLQCELEEEIAVLKKTFTEVEKIACIRMDCKIREPELGTYKHKKEA